MFKTKLAMLLISITIGASTLAQEKLKPYPKTGLYKKLNPIELKNRASCSKDSALPTRSSFLLLDNTNVAKAAYRFAKVTNQNTNKITTDIIKKYRKKVVQMTLEVHDKLVSAQLPLLPVISEKSFVPKLYDQILRSCHEKESCHELDAYIKSLWNKSKYRSHRLVDNFNKRRSYIKNSKVSSEQSLTCFQVKKFSPLQSHLYGSKPDESALLDMVNSIYEEESNVGDCASGDVDNIVVGTYQFDISDIDQKYWDEVGFDYWNSLKIYLSWALRNSLVFDRSLERIIQNTDISDSLMFVSNGCKSVAVPECSNDYVAKNVIREFSAKDFETNAADLDILSSIPNGAQDDMIKDPFTAVNTDILDLSDHDDSSSWVRNLFDNFSKTKSYLRSRVVKAINYYTVMNYQITPQRLVRDLNSYYSKMNMNDKRVVNDMYYMCTEAKVAADDEFGQVKEQLEIITKTNFLKKHGVSFIDIDLEDVYSSFTSIMKETIKFCNSVDRSIWERASVDKKGFSAWYLLKTKSKQSSNRDDFIRELNDKSYLHFGKSKDVFCQSPSGCVRKSIDYILDLSRAAHYAKTFWNGKNSVNSSELFNPYAERTVCKVYDPLYKSKSLLLNFISDVTQAAVSFFTPGVIYTKLNLKPGTVTSFSKMVKDGEILIDAKVNKQKVIADVTAEFGNLLNIPCAISVSEQRNYGQNLYHFQGVSIGLCSEEESSQIDVYSANDIQVSDPSSSGACFSCRLNFESVSNILNYFDVAIGPSYYLVRAFVRLFRGLRDPHNIPRRWSVDFTKLMDAYTDFGTIPKACTSSLREGKSCSITSNEKKFIRDFKSKYKTKLISIEKMNRESIKAKIEGCDKDINFRYDREYLSFSNPRVPKNCELKKW